MGHFRVMNTMKQNMGYPILACTFYTSQYQRNKILH